MRHRLKAIALLSFLLMLGNASTAQNAPVPVKAAPPAETAAQTAAAGAANTTVAQPAAGQLTANISKIPFGTDSYGDAIDLYTMQNAHGMVAKLMTFGATLTQLLLPDASGNLVDVILGFDTQKAYEDYPSYFGCTLGRVAGRIRDASFTLNGKEYQLKPNSGPNTIHGGVRGFDKQLWKAQPIADAKNPAIKFTYLSPNMHEGFPGNLNVSVTYTLTDDNSLKIDYTATTDKPTPVNLSNHAYFNLAGAGQGDVLHHILQINADTYLPLDPLQLPTGAMAPVKGTPYDFTEAKAMGADINKIIGGYNHYYILAANNTEPTLAATVFEPQSGRTMQMFTTDLGVQFSTGNQLGSTPKAGIGGSYIKYSGFLLYDMRYPDALHNSNFPSIILQPGQTYKKSTIYKFTQGAPAAVPQIAPPAN